MTNNFLVDAAERRGKHHCVANWLSLLYQLLANILIKRKTFSIVIESYFASNTAAIAAAPAEDLNPCCTLRKRKYIKIQDYPLLKLSRLSKIIHGKYMASSGTLKNSLFRNYNFFITTETTSSSVDFGLISRIDHQFGCTYRKGGKKWDGRSPKTSKNTKIDNDFVTFLDTIDNDNFFLSSPSITPLILYNFRGVKLETKKSFNASYE